MATVSVTEARATLPELLDRVAAGEEVTITRHGRAAAVVVRPDALRSRRAERALADADRIRELIEAGRVTSVGARPGMRSARAEEQVAEIRAGRRRG